MTVTDELTRLFAEVFPKIPAPDPLEPTFAMCVTHDGNKFSIERIPMRRAYLQPAPDKLGPESEGEEHER